MSKGKSVTQNNKRVSSITRKLTWRLVGRKIKLYLGYDFILFFLLSGAFFATQEYLVNDGTVHMYALASRFSSDNSQWTKNGYYCLLDEEGQLISIKDIPMEGKQAFLKNTRYFVKHLNFALKNKSDDTYKYIGLYEPLLGILIVQAVLLVIQLTGLLFSFYKESQGVKKLLSPINEMALKIDELSKLTMSEERYHEIENALDTIKPGENFTLSLGNDDLKGIEAAMNNLIIRMRDSYRQQARFVNDASHELRTPITVIHGYVSMLDRWGKTDEKILGESIEAIKNETDHMQHLVEQLLFLARGDSGKTTLKMENFCLNDMTREVYEESLMIDENHVYRFVEGASGISINADYSLLKQAFRILIDNAAKYTKAGDEIVISMGENEDNAPYIQVQDTGIGMSEQDTAKMFERFYRSDNARNFQGTGLGLSIAKWIVDKHGGRFEVLSRTELGTRIRIVLPRQ